MARNHETPEYVRVLVIDDNAIDRYIAKRNIEKYLFADEITLIESAKKAIDYLASLEKTPELLPKFIFLDIRMPEMDGFGFLEQYHSLDEKTKSSCVIMMLSTSLDQADHERASENPYVNKFLNKPLDREKIELLKLEFQKQ